MRAFWFFLTLFSAGFAAADQLPTDKSKSCVEIEVDGIATPSFSCLTQKLRPAVTRRQIPEAELNSGNATRRPGNQMGLFNQAATGHRMGNTFGTSVLPQRPNNAPPASP